MQAGNFNSARTPNLMMQLLDHLTALGETAAQLKKFVIVLNLRIVIIIL